MVRMTCPLLCVLCLCLLLGAGCAPPVSAPSTSGEPTAVQRSVTGDQEPAPYPTLVAPNWRNLPYVLGGSAQQRLDIYLPEGDGPFPTLLAVHGGGFRAGSKLLYQEMAGRLNELGYAVVSTDYRLAPRHSYPAQVADVFCALAWVHENHADYGLDNERIFAMGDSAGGYLAAMLGTVDTPGDYLHNCPQKLPASDWLRGVVVFYGFFDFTNIDGFPAQDVATALEPYWGAEYGDISAGTLAEMSPMSMVDGSEPPFLLIHGTADTAIPSWMSEDFATRLEEAGVGVETLLLPAGHAFLIQPLASPPNVQSIEAIRAFLSVQVDQ